MLVETWLKVSDPVVVAELEQPGYRFLSTPRDSINGGGGVGVLFKEEMKWQIFDTEMKFHTFEFACFTTIVKDVFYFLVYRPYPSSENGLKTSQFLIEFDNFVEFINTMSSKIIILGDFNLHVDTLQIWSITFSHNTGQCRFTPTRCWSHTQRRAYFRSDNVTS